jgi:hypothetical protein
MNEKVRKVFDLLGVEPYEEFKINISRGSFVYRFDDDFVLEYKDGDDWNESTYQMADILRGEIEIVKLPPPTEADKNAVRYLRDGGMKYVARDGNGLLYAYESKPLKTGCGWRLENENITPCRVFKNLFQFVQWTDKEPFCIEDLEV